MKQKFKLHTLKFVKDESVKIKLSKQFPVNWDMDRIFEKSYRNYLKQSGKKEIPHFIIVKRNSCLRTVVTVACIALTCGAVGITAFLQKSAPEFKDSTQRETTATTSQSPIVEIPETVPIQTEITTIATNPIASEMDTTPSELETESFSDNEENISTIPETIQPTDPTEPPETKPPMQTTAPQETIVLTLEMIDTIPQTEPLPQPAQPLEIVPIATAPIEPTPTNPPPIEPTQPESQEPITEPTAPLETIPFEPEPTEPPFNNSVPIAPNDPSDNSSNFDPKPSEGKLTVTTDEDGKRTICYQWGENLTTQEIQEHKYEELKNFPNLQYAFHDDSYTFEVGSSYSFTLTDKETGKVIIISHAPYWNTYSTVNSKDYRIELLSINLKNAYVVAMPETTVDGVTDCLCTLIWDTGKSVGMISGLYSDLKKYIDIAWSLYVY